MELVVSFSDSRSSSDNGSFKAKFCASNKCSTGTGSAMPLSVALPPERETIVYPCSSCSRVYLFSFCGFTKRTCNPTFNSPVQDIALYRFLNIRYCMAICLAVALSTPKALRASLRFSQLNVPTNPL